MSEAKGLATAQLEASQHHHLLIVGAFPEVPVNVHGGILTSCRTLMASSLPRRLRVTTIDSMSPTVPPPPFFSRLLRAVGRLFRTIFRIASARPDAVLLFASPGFSFVEKSAMGAVARLFGARTLMFPRGAELIAQFQSSRVHRAILRVCFRIPTLMLCQGTIYHEFFTGTWALFRTVAPSSTTGQPLSPCSPLAEIVATLKAVAGVERLSSSTSVG